MPRPCKCRCVDLNPLVVLYKPQGIPARELEMVRLGLDELEAVRLADRLGLYHTEAARRMGISRATFGRVLERGRAKIAEALIEGKGLIFMGGAVTRTAPPESLERKE